MARTADSDAAIRLHNEAALPVTQIISLKRDGETFEKSAARRFPEADEQYAGMGARLITPRIREIQILRNEETTLALCRPPDIGI